MTQSARPLPQLSPIILEGSPGPSAAPNTPHPLWQVTYRQYDCADEQQQLVRASDATAARRILEESLGIVGCRIIRVTPFAALPAGAARQHQVRGSVLYAATQFNYLGDHPAVRMAVTPRSPAVGFAAYSSTAATETDQRFPLKPGWWLLEKDGRVMAAVPPAQFAAGFEPVDPPADAGVRAGIEALCLELYNEALASSTPAEKRGLLHATEKLKAILAAH